MDIAAVSWLLLMAGLFVYYSWRMKEDSPYRCVRCGNVFQSEPSDASCPLCGRTATVPLASSLPI